MAPGHGEKDAPQGGGHGEGSEAGHVSVLLQEAITFLSVRRGGTYIDATLGLGGHAFAVARRLGAQGRLIGFDKDPSALEIARRRLAPPADAGGDWPEVRLIQGSFTQVAGLEADSADGLLADLGLSSLQLADAARGFSFLAEGALDMRMDPQSGPTAEQVVNRLDEVTLAHVIYEFGEERRSRRIARAIVRARPIRNSLHLAQVISAAFRSMKPGRVHPATRTFQAIRIHVNRELEELGALLDAAPRVLRSGGRLVVISFHSLEDRRVKDALRQGGRAGTYRVLTPKPVTASEEEVQRNPRSRSAKLRAAERI